MNLETKTFFKTFDNLEFTQEANKRVKTRNNVTGDTYCI